MVQNGKLGTLNVNTLFMNDYRSYDYYEADDWNGKFVFAIHLVTSRRKCSNVKILGIGHFTLDTNTTSNTIDERYPTMP